MITCGNYVLNDRDFSTIKERWSLVSMYEVHEGKWEGIEQNLGSKLSLVGNLFWIKA